MHEQLIKFMKDKATEEIEKFIKDKQDDLFEIVNYEDS